MITDVSGQVGCPRTFTVLLEQFFYTTGFGIMTLNCPTAVVYTGVAGVCVCVCVYNFVSCYSVIIPY